MQRIIQKNTKTLMGYVRQIFDNINSGLDTQCPERFRTMFEYIRLGLEKKFPTDQTSRLRGLSGFIFLRFFCSAIFSPMNYGLLEGFILLYS